MGARQHSATPGVGTVNILRAHSGKLSPLLLSLDGTSAMSRCSAIPTCQRSQHQVNILDAISYTTSLMPDFRQNCLISAWLSSPWVPASGCHIAQETHLYEATLVNFGANIAQSLRMWLSKEKNCLVIP